MRRTFEDSSGERPLSLQDVLRCTNEALYRDQRDAFIGARLKILLSMIKPITIDAKRFGMYEGFIHPESIIFVTQHERIPGFRVDDPTLFQHVIDALRKKRSLPDAVQSVIDTYFSANHASPDKNTSERRVQKYGRRKSDEHLGIWEIAEAHIAMCAEKSAVAQSLITFFGTRAWLMDSYARLTRRDGGIDDGQHLYNVLQITPRNYLLYDASHPFEVSDAQGSIVETKPAQFPLTQEQFEALQSGEALCLQHREERQRDGQIAFRDYVYGGHGSLRK